MQHKISKSISQIYKCHRTKMATLILVNKHFILMLNQLYYQNEHFVTSTTFKNTLYNPPLPATCCVRVRMSARAARTSGHRSRSCVSTDATLLRLQTMWCESHSSIVCRNHMRGVGAIVLQIYFLFTIKYLLSRVLVIILW